MQLALIQFVAFTATCVVAVHPGQCPAIDSDAGGICVELCSSDSDCMRHQKCCSSGCGHACTNVIQPRIGHKPLLQCPPVGDGDLVGSCVEECTSDDQCEDGKRCCSNGCGHACAEPVGLPVKHGKCPAWNARQDSVGACSEECSSDGDCDVDMKCCSNGCGHACVEPVHMTNVTKPGRCPTALVDSYGICSEYCVFDGDCPDKQKCCSNGCGHACVEPTRPKDGQCPEVPEGLGGVCSEDCHSDTDCEGEKKCCNNGCGHACMDPEGTAPRPGQCPILDGDTVGICWEECSSDTDCEKTERCCSNGCGHVCMDTTTIAQHTGCRLEENYYEDGESIVATEECKTCHCFAGEIRCKVEDDCKQAGPFAGTVVAPLILSACGLLLSLILVIVIVKCFLFRATSKERYKLMHKVREFEPIPASSSGNVL